MVSVFCTHGTTATFHGRSSAFKHPQKTSGSWQSAAFTLWEPRTSEEMVVAVNNIGEIFQF